MEILMFLMACIIAICSFAIIVIGDDEFSKFHGTSCKGVRIPAAICLVLCIPAMFCISWQNKQEIIRQVTIEQAAREKIEAYNLHKKELVSKWKEKILSIIENADSSKRINAVACDISGIDEDAIREALATGAKGISAEWTNDINKYDLREFGVDNTVRKFFNSGSWTLYTHALIIRW